MKNFFEGTEQDKRKILEWMRTYKQNWTDREWARQEVLGGIDLEMQLLAIKSLLSRNQQAEDDLEREIDDLYKQSRQAAQGAQDSGDSRWEDRLHEAFFEDTANSMAAVGLLAPFVEALFETVFQRLKAKAPRHQRKTQAEKISQRAGSIGLEQFLPKDYRKTLDALFLYRNKTFHCGLEWPEKEREKFRDRSQAEDWPTEWFPGTYKNEAPWLFSISSEFIRHCLQTIDGILDGVGAYARSRGSEKNSVSPA